MNYTPQNVVEGDKKANERTDIYSVGVILYEMLTRETLLWGQAKQSFMDSHAELPRSAKDVIIRACQLLGKNNFKCIDDLQEKMQLMKLS